MVHQSPKPADRTCLLGGVQVDVNAQSFQRMPCIPLGSQFAYRADDNLLRSAPAIRVGLPPTKEPNQIATLASDLRQTPFLIPCSHPQVSLLFGEHGRQSECTRLRIDSSSSDKRNRQTRRGPLPKGCAGILP